MSHLRQQTHLLVRARQWEIAERNKSYLLQGSELRKAEQWLAEAQSKQPQATASTSRIYQHQSSSREGTRRCRNAAASLDTTTSKKPSSTLK